MLGVKIDDKLVAPVKVTQKAPSVLSVVIDVKRGMRPVAIAFMNPFNEADAAEPLPPAAGPAAPGQAGFRQAGDAGRVRQAAGGAGQARQGAARARADRRELRPRPVRRRRPCPRATAAS